MTKEEWEDYKKLSGEITDKLDNTATYESWLIIQEYVDRCQEKNKKYKEVIDKLNESIIELSDNTDDTTCYDIDRDCKNELLDILKEVE